MNRIITFFIAFCLFACAPDQSELEKHIQNGNRLIQSGHPEKALGEFRDALEIDDKNLDALYGLMDANEKVGNYINMLKTGQQIVALYPEHIQTHIKIATLYLTARMREDAEKQIVTLEKLTKAQPHPEVLALRASLLLAKNNVSEALAYAQHAISLDGNNVSAYIVLAKIASDKNEFSKALQYVDTAIAKKPDDSTLYMAKVGLLELMHQEDVLESTLIKLTQLLPGNDDVKKRLLKLYIEEKKYPQAISLTRDLIKRNSRDIELQLALVQLILMDSGAEKALLQIDTLIKEYPESIEFKLGKYALLREYSDYEQAQSTIQNVIATTSDINQRHKAISVYANDLIDLGYKTQGSDLIERVLIQDKGNSDALMVKGKLLVMEGDLPAAIIIYRELVNDFPNAVMYQEALANCYELSGSIDLANQLYYQHYIIDPLNNEVRSRYLQFLTKYKNTDMIRKILSDLVLKYPNDITLIDEYAAFEIAQNNAKKVNDLVEKLQQNASLAWMSNKVKADQWLSQKKYQEALSQYKLGLQKAKDEPSLISALVQTYVLMGDKRAALDTAAEAVNQHPNSFEMQRLLASTYAQYALNVAETDYRKLIDAYPDKVEVYLDFSRLYQKSGRYAQAETVLTEALSKKVTGKELKFELANVYYFQRKFENALKLYVDLVQRYPNEISIKSNLALLLLNHRSDQASYERAYFLVQSIGSNDHPEIIDIAGWAALKVGKVSSAIHSLERAAKLDADNGLIQFYLAKAYAALPTYPKAMQAYQKAKAEFEQSNKIDYTEADLETLKHEIMAIPRK